MRIKRGDRVRRRGDIHIGVVVNLRERGVAGSAVTYAEWIEVEYKDGTIVKGDPGIFEIVKDE